MAQNNLIRRGKFPAHYRHDLLDWLREKRGFNQQQVARGSEVNRETIRYVFAGIATNAHVYRVAKFLGADWMQVHNLKLKRSEFPLAVLNGKKALSGEEGEARL